MQILVTGGAGYIGSVTSELLLDEGHAVTVFDNLELGHRRAVDPRAELIEGDLRDAAAIDAAIARTRPDAVMHFAAYALVGESMAQPERYFGNNLQGGLNLAAAMLKHGVKRIVFSSTCATYGEPARVPITEAEPQRPTNPYGESKLMFERVLDWYRAVHGLYPVYLRYFNACGATPPLGEDHDPETHLIPIVLQVALGRRESVQIHGDDYPTADGTCVRDYIHVLDLARAHLLALDAPEPGAYNLGNGDGYSVREVIAAARDVTGHSIPARIGPRRPGDPPCLIAAADKARDLLGWTPRIPGLHDIIQSAWDWHRTHADGYGA
ncbi:MAG: UDP-glucose 4-epimerase GalE [Thiohalocapsa sp.]|jgi:UDP-glucose 4-epimerase|uniref:UDP-glucose 4-epimerase GalE n=1 Tax=Thiohalocapsa sp. TaxID=2497641 RepID=UPI0025E60AF0|nr:UDP-glucose 4-epimerase GalE [Thiohalocapsa sp.]MCG6940961.1 UDP-glucose 4-epimerase GalE [Thiohalocapsa sp.]